MSRIAAIAISVFLCGCSTESITLSEKIKTTYNLDLLRPASLTYRPGYVASVQFVDAGNQSKGRIVSLSRYCGPGSALTLENTPSSKTQDFTIVYDISGSASAKAEIVKLVGFDVSGKFVDKIEVTLKNPVIYRPDDLQLKAAVTAIRASGCSTKGRSLVTAVLKADVEVKTTFSSSGSVSVSQKLATGSIIGGAFGASASKENKEVLTGSGLFYGVEVDQRL